MQSCLLLLLTVLGLTAAIHDVDTILDSENKKPSESLNGTEGRHRHNLLFVKRAPTHKESSQLRSLTSSGDPLESYELNNRVGEGHFGRVYRGTRKRDGKSVAIKTVQMERHPDMLIRELQAMQAIKDDGAGGMHTLPSLYDAYRNVPHALPDGGDKANGRKLWIILEWVDGETIPESIRQHGNFSLSDVRIIMRQILATLVYLHERLRLVHGDLIPQNVMLDSRISRKITLVDFGLSRMIGESQSKIVAWELSKCGAIAYRLLFTEMPWRRGKDGNNQKLQLRDVLNTEEHAKKIPRELVPFLKACVAPEASARKLLAHPFLAGKGSTRRVRRRSRKRDFLNSSESSPNSLASDSVTDLFGKEDQKEYLKRKQ